MQRLVGGAGTGATMDDQRCVAAATDVCCRPLSPMRRRRWRNARLVGSAVFGDGSPHMRRRRFTPVNISVAGDGVADVIVFHCADTSADYYWAVAR